MMLPAIYRTAVRPRLGAGPLLAVARLGRFGSCGTKASPCIRTLCTSPGVCDALRPQRSDRSSPVPPAQHRHQRISPHEYNLRVGRAVEVLKSTLPEFMTVGLLDYPELHRHLTHHSDSRNKLWSLVPGLSLAEGLLAPLTGSTGQQPEDESIYHPSVQFLLRAPMGSDRSVSHSLESGHNEEENGPSLSFSGRALYLTSSHILRTALNVLFTRPQILVDRVHFVRGTQSPGRDSPSPASAPFPGSFPGTGTEMEPAAPSQDELLVRLRFAGQLRVARTQHEYTVVFKYIFDEHTGQILVHSVERIQPAPAKHMWLGLTSAMRMANFGLGWGLGRPTTMSTVPLPAHRQRDPNNESNSSNNNEH